MNWLARLPVQPKLDAESLSGLLSLFFFMPAFPAQASLSTGCLLSGGAFYHPTSVPSVQTCGWDTALLAFPSLVTPLSCRLPRRYLSTKLSDQALCKRPLSLLFSLEDETKQGIVGFFHTLLSLKFSLKLTISQYIFLSHTHTPIS